MKNKKRNSFKFTSTHIIVACSLIILIVLFFITPSLDRWYQKTSFDLNASVVVAALGVLVTGIICWLTAVSVKEVIRSNTENRIYNLAKEQKDTFENQFSILLQEHNNYLNKLIDAKNELYAPNHILYIEGFEALSIIRGKVKRITTPNLTCMLNKGELLIKLEVYTDGKLLFINPQKADILDKNLIHYTKSEFFLSQKECIYFVINKNHIEEYYSFNSDQVSILTKKLKNTFLEIEPKFQKLIRDNNEVSRNILSPYMRIIYHILKLVKRNTNNIEEMKQYTNIIRSIIPNNILILIAINSMYYYRNMTDRNDKSYRWYDFIVDDDSLERQVTNDYYKYYNLLKESEFFEHLAMDFKQVAEDYNKLNFNPKFDNINFQKMIRDNGRGVSLFVKCDNDDTIKKTYQAIANSIYINKTDILILGFYFIDKKNDSLYLLNKKFMSNFIRNKNNFTLEWKLKSKLHFLSISSIRYNSGEYLINIDENFLNNFFNGKLIFISKASKPNNKKNS
jgi:hypothetical protein